MNLERCDRRHEGRGAGFLPGPNRRRAGTFRRPPAGCHRSPRRCFNNYGGEVIPGFDVTITKPVGSPGGAQIYYTTDGSDPRLAGGGDNPLAVHGSGPISVDIDVAKQIKARIKNGTHDWSPLIDATFTLPDPFPVRIIELMYHPADPGGVTDPEDLEFIEFLNTGSSTVSLDGVQDRRVFADARTTFPAA